jgi:ribosome biogenesis GTPase A
MIGSMNDDNIDSGELAIDLIKELESDYSDVVFKTYNITDDDVESAIEEEHLMTSYSGMLCAVAKSRNLLLPGARPDYMRAANLILDDFRAGRLGRITLENAPM